MALKPLRVEVDCVFQCRVCETETWYTLHELKHRKHLCCPCGHRCNIEPVTHVEVGYAGNVSEQLDQSGQRTGPAIDVDDFVATLVTLGHRKVDAHRLVREHAAEYDGDDAKFITRILNK